MQDEEVKQYLVDLETKFRIDSIDKTCNNFSFIVRKSVVVSY